MKLPLAIWTTGRPVPAAEAARGSFYDMIVHAVGDAWSGTYKNYDCVRGDDLPKPEEVAGVIVTGSPARVRTREPWILAVERQLERYVASDTPLLGICFGHQLLGEALGGHSGPNPEGREIGTPDLHVHTKDELFDGLEEHPPVVMMTHLDSVLELPRGATALGRTEKERHAAVRFGPRTWGVQFHPEMDADVIGHYLEDRRADILREGLDVDEIEQQRRDSTLGSGLLRRFARMVARGR